MSSPLDSPLKVHRDRCGATMHVSEEVNSPTGNAGMTGSEHMSLPGSQV